MVPELKIREQYYRSLDLLMHAVEYSDRCFIFAHSNEGQRALFMAEIQSAKQHKLNLELNAVTNLVYGLVCRERFIRIHTD